MRPQNFEGTLAHGPKLEEGRVARIWDRVTREEPVALFATHLRPGRVILEVAPKQRRADFPLSGPIRFWHLLPFGHCGVAH